MSRSVHFVVADDESASRTLIERILRKSFPRCSVTHCDDGAQALELIEFQAPALLVTDFNMPHSSGARLLLAMRHRAVRIPVVVISNSDHGRLASLEAGADFFLNKSELFDLPRVIETLLPRDVLGV